MNVFYKDGTEIKLGDYVEVTNKFDISHKYKIKLELGFEEITGDDYNYTPCIMILGSEKWVYQMVNGKKYCYEYPKNIINYWIENLKQSFKHKYLRNYIRINNIKDNYVKSGLYGAVFNLPKKVLKALNKSKNNNHEQYLLKKFLSVAIKSNSREVVFKLNLYKSNFVNT